MIIVNVVPDHQRYRIAVDEANRAIGGNGNAGAAGNPIQFLYATDWMLQVNTGREDARRVAAFMRARFIHENLDFEAVVMDVRTLLKDA